MAHKPSSDQNFGMQETFSTAPSRVRPSRVSSEPVVFTVAQNQACIQASNAYATISTSYMNAYNSYMHSNYYPAGCNVNMVYSVTPSGVDCQAVAGQAISLANQAVPAYFTANPLFDSSLCVGGVCGSNGCAQPQYAIADSGAISAEPLLMAVEK